MASHPTEVQMRKQEAHSREKKENALFTPANNVHLLALCSLARTASRLRISTVLRSFQGAFSFTLSFRIHRRDACSRYRGRQVSIAPVFRCEARETKKQGGLFAVLLVLKAGGQSLQAPPPTSHPQGGT